jgi:hypothetical protein
MVGFYSVFLHPDYPYPIKGIHLNKHGASIACLYAQRAILLDRTGLWSYPEDHPLKVSVMLQQCGLVRDIFGNPFRPVTFDPHWHSADAAGVARAMYESRDFAAMPILLDALLDAGCDSPDILDHCRSPGPHVRGCWVVDLVLGKS